jgi:XTP/dITP diphosphohydrolase
MGAPAELVLATANPGKVRELRRLIAEWGPVGVRSLAGWSHVVLPPEDGATYEENAVAKARAVSEATGLAALGDDSGLEVVGLDGGPGVRSARYAATDEARIEKLLTALRGRGEAARVARFVCVVALAWPDGRVDTAVGECHGRIAERPRGEGGFGYDPVFVVDELGVTFAEASSAEKEARSHRGRAVRALGERLAAD